MPSPKEEPERTLTLLHWPGITNPWCTMEGEGGGGGRGREGEGEGGEGEKEEGGEKGRKELEREIM